MQTLIDLDTKQWRYLLNEEIFSSDDAKIIKKIPISLCNSLDKLIRRGNTNGQFSVRGVYHMQKEMQDRSKGQPPSSNIHKEIWLRIWS